MLEQQLDTPCAQNVLDENMDLRNLLDEIDREGGLDGQPAKPRSKKELYLDRTYEYYVNSLLSGPYTQAKNVAGNAVPLAGRIIETAAAIPISRIQQAMGLEVDKVTYNELVAEAGGVGRGFVDAFSFINIRLKSMLKQGVTNEDILKEINVPAKLATQAKIERENRAISGANIDNATLRKFADGVGNIVNFPGALLSSMDVFFKVINYRAEVSKQAMRLAANSGATDSKAINGHFNAIMADVTQGKRKDLVDAGVDNADLQTFTNRPLGKINIAMAEGGHDLPGVRWIVPFRRTMVNILSYGAERTPLGAFSSRTQAALKEGGAAQAEAISRMAMGTGALIGLFSLLGDHMTGEAPRDAQAKDLWLKNGNEPYSINIGGVNFDMELMGPMEPALKAMANAQRIMSTADYEIDENGEMVVFDVAQELSFAMADSFLSTHWMSNLAGFMSSVDRSLRDNSPDPLINYTGRFAAGFVPNISKTPLQNFDPGVKDINAPWEHVMSRLPGLSSMITDKIDLWGDVMTHDHFIDPTLASKITGKDAVAAEMQRMDMHIPVSGKTQRGVTMTPKEYQQYMILAGKGTFGLPPLREALANGMKDPMYKKFNTDIGRSAYLKSIIGSYRKSALGHMEMTTDWGKRVNVQRELTARNQGVSP